MAKELVAGFLGGLDMGGNEVYPFSFQCWNVRLTGSAWHLEVPGGRASKRGRSGPETRNETKGLRGWLKAKLTVLMNSSREDIPDDPIATHGLSGS